jgi:hypothetical protein
MKPFTNLLAAVVALSSISVATLNAEQIPANDPDVLKYPAPKLLPRKKGCVTVHGESTIGRWPNVSHICVGDSAKAKDRACPSVAALFHTDKNAEDSVEDMNRRERKFGCKDIEGSMLHVVEIYQLSDNDAYACGLDDNKDKWCLRIEFYEGTTTVTAPDGKTFKPGW